MDKQAYKQFSMYTEFGMEEEIRLRTFTKKCENVINKICRKEDARKFVELIKYGFNDGLPYFTLLAEKYISNFKVIWKCEAIGPNIFEMPIRRCGFSYDKKLNICPACRVEDAMIETPIFLGMDSILEQITIKVTGNNDYTIINNWTPY